MFPDTHSVSTSASRKMRRFLLNRPFALLWSGQTISTFGSHISRDGLPIAAILVLKATPLQMGLLASVDVIPVLLVGLFAGVLVDRLPRRPILILADIGRAILLSIIPLAALLGLLHIELLYLVAIVVGALTVFFEIANRSFLPTLLRKEEIVEGNSKLETSSALAEIAGPPLAGLLVQLITAPIAILFDALSFVVSALCIGSIRVSEQPDKAPKEDVHVWREISAGWHALFSNPLLRALAMYAGMRYFFGGAFAALYALYTLRLLHLQPVEYGILVMMGGIGGLFGALFAPHIVRRVGIGRALLGAALLDGILTLGTPLASGGKLLVMGILMLTQLVGDAGMAIYAINEVSLRQASIPDRFLGRVNATMHVIVGVIGPLGALLASILSGYIGIRSTLLIGALGILLSTGWLFCSPLRQLKNMGNV